MFEKTMFEKTPLTRRQMLKTGALALAGLSVLPSSALAFDRRSFDEPKKTPYSGTDDQLLDEIQRAAFDFFWHESDQLSGQVKDRALVNGSDLRRVASVAATGFGLTALCIAESRGYGNTAEIRERVRQTLRFLRGHLATEHGFFYHFFDMESGIRVWNCELSPIDSSILFCGVLTARQHFEDAEIQDLATVIYDRVDWNWMLNGGEVFSMGWKPMTGFFSGSWDHYCELMMMYLLALGSSTHPVSSDTWKAFSRPRVKFDKFEYISGTDPLFTHQYSHAWFDFRHKRDEYADYFANSVMATQAHKQFCLSMRDEFPDYSQQLWGISASDSAAGYQAWGGPPRIGRLDGSIVPCAAAGSLPFLQAECLEVLRNIRERYPKAWGRYGFVDAFNPLNGWYNQDVLGIDVGITMVMAENVRSEFVWKTFMKNQEAQRGMERAGFKSTDTIAAGGKAAS